MEGDEAAARVNDFLEVVKQARQLNVRNLRATVFRALCRGTAPAEKQLDLLNLDHETDAQPDGVSGGDCQGGPDDQGSA